MKRLNITIDPQTYENARIAAFLTKSNISSIIRSALNEWFNNHHILSKKQLILEKSDINSIKKILEDNEFIEYDKVKEELKL